MSGSGQGELNRLGRLSSSYLGRLVGPPGFQGSMSGVHVWVLDNHNCSELEAYAFKAGESLEIYWTSDWIATIGLCPDGWASIQNLRARLPRHGLVGVNYPSNLLKASSLRPQLPSLCNPKASLSLQSLNPYTTPNPVLSCALTTLKPLICLYPFVQSRSGSQGPPPIRQLPLKPQLLNT